MARRLLRVGCQSEPGAVGLPDIVQSGEATGTDNGYCSPRKGSAAAPAIGEMWVSACWCRRPTSLGRRTSLVWKGTYLTVDVSPIEIVDDCLDGRAQLVF
jgi:hypothetical protein